MFSGLVAEDGINVAVPRTFQGTRQPPTDSLVPDGTQVPLPPQLLLHSNRTLGYLTGPLSTRVIPVVYLLLITVGIPANIAILCTLVSKIRKVSSAILYCSLSVSDLLFFLSLIFKAHYHLYGNHWLLGEPACRAVTACFYGNLYCSVQALACISINRYLAVVHPFTYKHLPKRMCSAWVTAAVWLVFAVAAVPELLIQQSYSLPQLGTITCHDVLPLDSGYHVFWLCYNLLLTFFGLLLPLGVTIVCYTRIMCELNQSHVSWAMYIKASSLNFVIFLVCVTPAGVLHFVHYVQLFMDGTESLYVYFNVAVCLCCLRACLDPFLLVIMSKSSGSRLFD